MTWGWNVPSPLPSSTDTVLPDAVGDGEVEAAVAVEVPGHDRVRARPDRVGDLGLERAVAVAQQHRHVLSLLVGDGEVEVAVAGEVPGHDRVGLDPTALLLGLSGWKVPSPLPSNTDTVSSAVVGDGEVEVAVAGEIAGHDRVGCRPDRVSDLGLERAVAVAQQHRHRVAAYVGDGEVEVAVAVEIPGHDRMRDRTRRRR